eukprot:s210_g8.t1
MKELSSGCKELHGASWWAAGSCCSWLVGKLCVSGRLPPPARTARTAKANRRAMAKKDSGKSVLDLERYLNQPVKVKFTGGREVKGILKGHDAVANLVLDDVQEYLRDPEDPYKVSDETRSLGLVVARGTSLTPDGFCFKALATLFVEHVDLPPGHAHLSCRWHGGDRQSFCKCLGGPL